ncbi:hypothetical protein IV500_14960 [Paeniglutamicibacter antarcticus]|uniref:Uncharacterized protein n=1 Tax=Arthrobacter terrae TaxID=2935737 RepID=A0A931CVJ5_9MICC|nr:hypothetical protein [Arthrobacter terrae]MBG0740678.1 hypothetical protein [Arthrobacter terrae]
MRLEFYEPDEAAVLLRCSEAWLRAGAANCEFPHLTWGKGKIIFTDEHLEEIAHLREVKPHILDADTRRVIGTRAERRLK